MILDSIKLRKLRDVKKYSQAELGRLIELAPQRIWEWEQKDCNVKIEHIIKLAEALEVDLNDLTKEATTLNILINNHPNKDNSQDVVGFDINFPDSHIHAELLKTLKTQIDVQNKQIESQNKVLEEYSKHTTFLEDMINWFKTSVKN